MALQLSSHAEFNLNSSQTKELLLSCGISNALQKHHPKIHQLVQYNAVGAVKFLIASGCMTGGIQKSKFKIKRELHNISSVDAWSEYKKAVRKWLKENVNDSADLKKARKFLRDEICGEWCRKAPCWPGVGRYGPTLTKDLDYQDEVATNNYIYVWSALGTIKMQDYMASETEFHATIWGDPTVTLKCVRMDQQILKRVNQGCIDDWQGMKKEVDQMANKSIESLAAKLKAISWDELVIADKFTHIRTYWPWCFVFLLAFLLLSIFVLALFVMRLCFLSNK